MKQLIYYHSGQKMVFEGENINALTDNIAGYLKRRGEEDVDETIIRKAVEDGIHDKPKNSSFKSQKKAKRSMTAKGAMRTSLAIIKSMTTPVDQAIFDTRQKICKSCSLYQMTSDCRG